MSQKVRVPDHVHERLERESEQREIPQGAVVEQWMHTVDRFDLELEADDE